jgi:hypothetical protein
VLNTLGNFSFAEKPVMKAWPSTITAYILAIPLLPNGSCLSHPLSMTRQSRQSAESSLKIIHFPKLVSTAAVPSPPQIDSELFKAKLSNTLCLLPRTPFLKTSAVEELIVTITSTIANVAHASKINFPRQCTVKRCLGGPKNSAPYGPKSAPTSRRGPNVKLHKARCNTCAANPLTIVLTTFR